MKYSHCPSFYTLSSTFPEQGMTRDLLKDVDVDVNDDGGDELVCSIMTVIFRHHEICFI